MKWEDFLEQILTLRRVALVGPLLGRPHVAEAATIYVDGGLRYRDLKSSKAWTSLGDGDSAPLRVEKRLPAEKDFSDFSFALSAIPENIEYVELLGFLGGRRDHEILNLGEAHRFLESRTRFTWLTFDDEVVGLVHGALELEIHGTFSLIAFAPARVALTGACRYPLSHARELPALSSLGLSNEGSGLTRIEAEDPCFIWLNGSGRARTANAVADNPV